jgi:hypothetical protein
MRALPPVGVSGAPNPTGAVPVPNPILFSSRTVVESYDMAIAPEAIDYYTKTYGFSEAEARVRLVDQSREW